MVRELEHLCCDKRLRFGVVHLAEEKALGKPYYSLSILKVVF